MDKGFTIPVLDKGYVRFVDSMGDDTRIVEAARVSYGSPSKGLEQDKKLLHYLYKNRHTSPLEQCNITFNIKLPLFVQGQMVRHRTQRLNQMSARYTEMPDEFYIPAEWRGQDNKNKQGSVTADIGFVRGSDGNDYTASEALIEQCRTSYELYKAMLKAGISKEMARMHLPQNLYTEIYSNWDVHNLCHFFTLRLDKHAQWEIRLYAEAMFKIFKNMYPWTAEAFEKFKFKLVEIV